MVVFQATCEGDTDAGRTCARAATASTRSSRNAAPHLIEIIVHLHLQRSDEARDRLWAEVDAFFENVET
jgi:hypothetical protein